MKKLLIIPLLSITACDGPRSKLTNMEIYELTKECEDYLLDAEPLYLSFGRTGNNYVVDIQCVPRKS